ncbi:MAG TPA: TPM domain-containing protein, partial [Methylocella sp.]|nr:TPM domain-containing protein [Methylocella sp.]
MAHLSAEDQHHGRLAPSRAETSAVAWLCLVAALFAAFASIDLAGAYTLPPLTGRVVDSASIIPPAVSGGITQKLASLEAKTRIQLVVATVKTLEGDDIEPYANALFRAWGLGVKGENNGVLLLVAPMASFVNEILEFDCHVRFPQIAEVVRSLRIGRPSARLRGSVFGPPDTGLRSGFPWA